jgi:hypothetical protein
MKYAHAAIAAAGISNGLVAECSSEGAGGASGPNNGTGGPKMDAEKQILANRREIHRSKGNITAQRVEAMI